MREKKRKSIGMTMLLFLLVLLFSVTASADSRWTLRGSAVQNGSVFVLTPSQSSKSGVLTKNVPLDTRQGIVLEFQYQISQEMLGPGEGFMLVFSNKPVVTDQYAYSFMGYWAYVGSANTNFCGIEFDTYEDGNEWGMGSHIAAVKNNGNDKVHLNYTSMRFSDERWHDVRVVYYNNTICVFQDDVQVLEQRGFYMPQLAYFGFTAGTHMWGSQQYAIRNVCLWANEASLLTLNPNGGTCSTSKLYALKNSNGKLPSATRTGYTFDGWYTAAKGGKKVTSTNYSFSAKQTLYAHWKAKQMNVSFHANGGSVKTKSKRVTFASAYGALPTPSRTGYTFAGWYTAAKGGAKAVKTTKVTKTGNHTLYAHWKANTYTVKFNACKGKVKPASKKVTYSQKIGTLPTPTRKNYTFLGWYTSAKGGKKITSNQKVVKNVTYYAHWISSSKKVKITLNKNGGSCKKSSITVKYGGKLGSLPKATRKGYTFLGWYTAKSGGTKVSSSTKTTTLLDTKKLYAHWKKKSASSGGSGGSGSSGGGSSYRPNCVMCNGTGRCSTCGGSGFRWSYAMNNNRLNCYKCNTSGRCLYCGGSGKRY